MSTIEYPNRLQRKFRLARYKNRPRVFFAKSLSQWLSRLERCTTCGLSGGSGRGNISDDAPGYGMAVRRVNRMLRSLSQTVPTNNISRIAMIPVDCLVRRVPMKTFSVNLVHHLYLIILACALALTLSSTASAQ